jgi:hypothetical protein
MLDRTNSHSGEAVIRYEDADFTILRPGAYVRCAVSGAQIPLEELRYWSVDRQEAYRSVVESVARARGQA